MVAWYGSCTNDAVLTALLSDDFDDVCKFIRASSEGKRGCQVVCDTPSLWGWLDCSDTFRTPFKLPSAN